MTEERAVVPIVGKALEIGVVVLLIGALSATLYGGVVPAYRTTAGEELGDRTLATAAGEIETAVPPNVTRSTRHRRVRLPDTIRGDTYVLRASGNATLALDHPSAGIGGQTRLVLPTVVVRFEGTWRSDEPAIVAVDRHRNRLEIRLLEG